MNVLYANLSTKEINLVKNTTDGNKIATVVDKGDFKSLVTEVYSGIYVTNFPILFLDIDLVVPSRFVSNLITKYSEFISELNETSLASIAHDFVYFTHVKDKRFIDDWFVMIAKNNSRVLGDIFDFALTAFSHENWEIKENQQYYQNLLIKATAQEMSLWI